MADWLTDLRFWSQTHGGAKRELACNHEDAERLQAAIDQAGLADLVELGPVYVIPRGHAWAHGDPPLDDAFYETLNIRRYV